MVGQFYVVPQKVLTDKATVVQSGDQLENICLMLAVPLHYLTPFSPLLLDHFPKKVFHPKSCLKILTYRGPRLRYKLPTIQRQICI